MLDLVAINGCSSLNPPPSKPEGTKGNEIISLLPCDWKSPHLLQLARYPIHQVAKCSIADKTVLALENTHLESQRSWILLIFGLIFQLPSLKEAEAYSNKGRQSISYSFHCTDLDFFCQCQLISEFPEQQLWKYSFFSEGISRCLFQSGNFHLNYIQFFGFF